MNKNSKFTKRLKCWLTEQMSGSESTKMKTENSNTSLPVQPNIVSKPLSAQTMPYGQFLDIILGEQPEPTEWPEIVIDYLDAVKTPKSENIFECKKKILRIEWLIRALDENLWLLKIEFDEDCAKFIQEQGYSLIANIEDRSEYLKQIYNVETEAKTLIILLGQYRIEHDILSGNKEGKVRTRVSYEKDIAVLSKFQGYRIDIWTTSVMQWAGILNTYMEDYKNKIPNTNAGNATI